MIQSPLRLAIESSRLATTRAYDYCVLTGPQAEVAASDHPRKVWVDGNAVGKSFGLAWEVISIILGRHPAYKRPRPVRVLVIGTSYEQMVPLMEKLWLLAPKTDLDPSCGFEQGRGITGKPPRLIFTEGPGRGSEILFATYRAGAQRIAGGQYDVVVLDEPPPESMYGEVRPRLLRRRGILLIGFTPVPDMPDVTYIKEKIARKKMEKHNFGLNEQSCWPAGFPAPWHWQEEIDAYAAELLDIERGMRILGDWTPVVTKRLIRDFNEAIHVRDDIDIHRDLPGWKLIVGMDHGTADGKQTAMLVAVWGGNTPRPRVIYLDEEVNDGFTTPEQDAAGVLAMLHRNNLEYDNVDYWIGDVPTGSRRGDIQKSNRRIQRELARILGRSLTGTKIIIEPTKRTGSLMDGARMMNALFFRRIGGEDGGPDGVPMALVRKCCERFIESLKVFNGDPFHPLKDVFDGGRYATERGISGEVQRVLHAVY